MIFIGEEISVFLPYISAFPFYLQLSLLFKSFLYSTIIPSFFCLFEFLLINGINATADFLWCFQAPLGSLVCLLTVFFFLFYFPVLLKYNRHTVLCLVKMYNVMILILIYCDLKVLWRTVGYIFFGFSCIQRFFSMAFTLNHGLATNTMFGLLFVAFEGTAQCYLELNVSL